MYDDRRGTRSNNYSDNRTRNSNGKSFEKPQEIKALPVPDDYVDAADAVMQKLGKRVSDEKYKFDLTTSKLRNIYSIVCDIYNYEMRSHDETISKESNTKLQKLRIRVLYEAGRESGREQSVKRFVKEAKMLEYIKGIDKNRENMLRFCHYMEALVAYHRFYGGKES